MILFLGVKPRESFFNTVSPVLSTLPPRICIWYSKYLVLYVLYLLLKRCTVLQIQIVFHKKHFWCYWALIWHLLSQILCLWCAPLTVPLEITSSSEGTVYIELFPTKAYCICVRYLWELSGEGNRTDEMSERWSGRDCDTQKRNS